MIYLFEDNEKADISRLYRYCYDGMEKKFRYACGNGKLSREAGEILETTKEEIVVFLDMLPDNEFCFKKFVDLSRMSRKNNYRVIVIPIVCSEYCMIKSIQNRELFLDKEEMEKCINLQPHKNSKIMADENVRRYCKNFEKYCKWILHQNTVGGCLKPYSETAGKNGEYYKSDCVCSQKQEICRKLSLKEKSQWLVSEYFSLSDKKNREMQVSDLWKLHRKQVDKYNEFTEKYLNLKEEYPTQNKYKKVEYIK